MRIYSERTEFNIIVTNALAFCTDRSSAAMEVCMQNKQTQIFHMDGFQIFAHS